MQLQNEKNPLFCPVLRHTQEAFVHASLSGHEAQHAASGSRGGRQTRRRPRPGARARTVSVPCINPTSHPTSAAGQQR